MWCRQGRLHVWNYSGSRPTARRTCKVGTIVFDTIKVTKVTLYPMVVLSEFYLVVLLLTTMTTFQGHTRGKPGSYKIFKLHTLVNSCPVHFKLRIHCLLMPTLIHVCFCFLKKEKRKKAVLKGDNRGIFCLDITFDFLFLLEHNHAAKSFNIYTIILSIGL